MEPQPKISVLIPTYNYAHFLDDAIQSVLNQSFKDFEMIIVDNQSTDNTGQVVEKYLHDPRISYYKNPVNIGMIGNFNKCLEYATGDYIKYLLADDKFHPELLEKFRRILDEHPNVCLVTSKSETFGLESRLRESPFEYLQPGEKIIKEAIRDGRGNFIGEPTTVMFRASNLKVGNFDPNFFCLVDLDFWFRQLSLGDCYFVPEVLSYFRIHEDQSSIVYRFDNWFEEYNFYKRIKTHNDYNINHSDLNLDRTIKKTAIKSAGAMYKLLPGLREKKFRTLFKRAVAIALKEGVLASSLVLQLTGKKKDK